MTTSPVPESRCPQHEETPVITKKARFSNSPKKEAASKIITMTEAQKASTSTVTFGRKKVSSVKDLENGVKEEAVVAPEPCTSGQSNDPSMEPLPIFTPRPIFHGTAQEARAFSQGSNFSVRTQGSTMSGSDLTVGLLFSQPLFPSPEVSVTTNASSFKGFSSDERCFGSEESSGKKPGSGASPPKTPFTQVGVRHATGAQNVLAVNIGIQFQNQVQSSRVLQPLPPREVTNNRKQQSVPAPVPLKEAGDKKKKKKERKKRPARRSFVRGKGCNCPKTRCLKLYCVCFGKGKFCVPSRCRCKKCQNTKGNAGPGGIREKKIEEIKAKRADAFEHRPRRKAGPGLYSSVTFAQTRRCLKKYCLCFESGTKCSPTTCSCKNCLNPSTLGGVSHPMATPLSSDMMASLPEDVASFSDLLELNMTNAVEDDKLMQLCETKPAIKEM